MLRRFYFLALALALLGAANQRPTIAQNLPGTTPAPAGNPGAAPSVAKEAPREKKQPAPKEAKNPKNLTAEGIAESVIFIYGSRPVLAQIRRNGVERGRVVRAAGDGRVEDISYEQRFVRGETTGKDKIRLDQKMAAAEYGLVYNEGRVWGVINGTTFTPRKEAASGFLAQTQHGLDALLRYKENGSTLAYLGKEKQKNIDMWVLEVTDKDKLRTRYYISAVKGRVLWLEYEEPPPGATEPVKYRRTFHDYRYAQNTLVPYRTIFYAGDKQIEEASVATVTYGVKMDDAYFQDPQAATATSQL